MSEHTIPTVPDDASTLDAAAGPGCGCHADAADGDHQHGYITAKDNYQRSDPLSLRDMSDAERAMRMQRVLAANPELMATLGAMLGGGLPA